MEFLEQIKTQYLNNGNNIFLLHGNTEDVFMPSKGKDELRLNNLLVEELFSKRDVVLFFNPGSGIKFHNEESRTEFMNLIGGYDALQGTKYFNQLPSSYGEIMKLLDRFIRIVGKKKSIAVILDYAQLLFPTEELSDLDSSDISATITILEWAKSTEVTSQNVTICLIAENLAEVNKLLVQTEKIAKVDIGFPDIKSRKQTIAKFAELNKVKLPMSQTALAEITNGFTTDGLIKLFMQCKGKTLALEQVKTYKKELIESKTGGLVEFIESKRTLDDVAGHDKAKKRLREDAKLIKMGQKEVMPMGYLIAGPVGTGKSYIAECFAGEIGIPAVKLKNFREKWVGATESNWERILTTVKALEPVLVIIDEADAALGSREQDGDSGTQQRVFAKLAETMGDTKNRGKIIWMLLTSRPDLLPIDLKRQGRAEVHIPLLYPDTNEEKIALFQSLAKKVEFELKGYEKAMQDFNLDEVYSGADVESILVKAKREEILKKNRLTLKEFQQIVESFRSSLDKTKIAAQIQAAIDEVTDKELLEK